MFEFVEVYVDDSAKMGGKVEVMFAPPLVQKWAKRDTVCRDVILPVGLKILKPKDSSGEMYPDICRAQQNTRFSRQGALQQRVSRLLERRCWCRAEGRQNRERALREGDSTM